MYKSKRGGDRSSSPISKRSRSSLGRYNEPESDEGTPERGRPGRGASPSPRARDYYDSGSSRRDTYKDPPHSSSSRNPYPYKVLCISALPAKPSDEMIRDSLYREFKRFGEISVKVVHEPDERVAYVYFRSYEEAREAKRSKGRIMVYDKNVEIEAAYESTSATSAGSSGGYGGSKMDSYGGDGRSGGGYGGSSGGYRRSPHPPPHQSIPGGGGPPPFYDSRREDHHHPRGGYGEPRGYPGPPQHAPHQGYGMRHNDYNRRDDGGYAGGGRGGGHQMYAPRYDKFAGGPAYDNNYGSNRYPPQQLHGPPRGPMPPPHAGGPPGAGNQAFENKKDKFPNYLQHIAPEDDPLATRTLFAGNLEVSISDEEMRRIFGRYGTVEDIDIKRPPPGTGNAYAFVRFANLDMASRAKSELSGQYIGKFQCKIGYGKVNPTTKIWVGGLGPWTNLKALEDEFDRFGVMKKIDWEKGDSQAFITYESIDAAQAAVKQMRGFALGGADKRIRTDFAGVEQIIGAVGSSGTGSSPYENPSYDSYKSNGRQNQRSSSNVNVNIEDSSVAPKNQTNAVLNSPELGGGTSPSDSEGSTSSRQKKFRNGGSGSKDTIATYKSIVEISKRETPGWQGSLILKNSAFPTKLYLTSGDLSSINILLKDEEGKDKLRITQRLRLDQSKLEDVTKRINTSSGYGIFLSMPISTGAQNSPLGSPSAGSSSPVQTRPLRNLVSYLKQKEAAGVISLANKSVDLTGVLYAFPPCKFSLELLQRSCPLVEETKDDYLVVVVIRGGVA